MGALGRSESLPNNIKGVELAGMSRHSSVVEQLIRNQQARGSTPRAGSSEIKGLAKAANPLFILGYHWGYHLHQDTLPPDFS